MEDTKQKPLSRKAQGEETRRILLETGARLFATKGFHGVSMRTLASEADVNLATAGYHFGGKAGLYEAILEKLFQDREAFFPSPDMILKRSKDEGDSPQGRAACTSWFIGQLVHNMLGRKEYMWPSFIISRELAQPTNLFPRIEEKLFIPSLESITTLINIVRPDMVDHEEVMISAHCIIGMLIKLMEVQTALIKRLEWTDYSDNIDKLSEVIEKRIVGLLGLTTETA